MSLGHNELTHWPQGGVVVILKTFFFKYFLNSFHWLISWALPVKLFVSATLPLNDWSILVQVMALCHQATHDYLSRCWPRSMSPFEVTIPQWVNVLSCIGSDEIKKERLCSKLVWVMAWSHQLPSHHLNQWQTNWPKFNRQHFEIRFLAFSWLKSSVLKLYWNNENFTEIYSMGTLLRPSDVIWRHGSGSTLAQVMAGCLTAPSHYLNQCWLVISKV